MGRHGGELYRQQNYTKHVIKGGPRRAGRITASSIRQIEEFQSDWQESIDQEKKKSKNGQHTQTKHKAIHSTPILTVPTGKVSYQANIRPISKPGQVKPSKNQNKNSSHSPATKKDGRNKVTMPTTVLIQPRPSSGRTQFRFNARFDTSRAKALVLEDIHDHFGSMDIITYPGPVGIEDANGKQINFMGEVTFKINILERVTTVSAWVTNEIPPGSLLSWAREY